MSPIDYLCRECGTSFEVGVGSLLSDDYQPGCPACESEHVQTDWDAVSLRFGELGDTPEPRTRAAQARDREERRPRPLARDRRSAPLQPLGRSPDLAPGVLIP